MKRGGWSMYLRFFLKRVKLIFPLPFPKIGPSCFAGDRVTWIRPGAWTQETRRARYFPNISLFLLFGLHPLQLVSSPGWPFIPIEQEPTLWSVPSTLISGFSCFTLTHEHLLPRRVLLFYDWLFTCLHLQRRLITGSKTFCSTSFFKHKWRQRIQPPVLRVFVALHLKSHLLFQYLYLTLTLSCLWNLAVSC